MTQIPQIPHIAHSPLIGTYDVPVVMCTSHANSNNATHYGIVINTDALVYNTTDGTVEPAADFYIRYRNSARPDDYSYVTIATLQPNAIVEQLFSCNPFEVGSFITAITPYASKTYVKIFTDIGARLYGMSKIAEKMGMRW